MQIFNEINARKLGAKEYNVFGGFFNNPLFLLILVATMVVQYFMVQIGGPSVRTVPLSDELHLICLAIGAGSLIWGVLVKACLPVSLFEKITVDDSPLPAGKVPLSKSLRSRSKVSQAAKKNLGSSGNFQKVK
jgi:hypothetical protein